MNNQLTTKFVIPFLFAMSLFNAVVSQGIVCGDSDDNSLISISDAVYLNQYIFSGGPAPNPLSRGNADGCRSVDIADAVFLINYMFAGGPAPGTNDCLNPTDCSVQIPGNLISISCPPCNAYQVGDSVPVYVCLSNTVPVGGFSIGFKNSSSSFRITSTVKGSVYPTPPGYGNFSVNNYFDEYLVGWLNFTPDAPIQPQSGGLLFTLWVRILTPAPVCIQFDSTFVGPAGPFMLAGQSGEVIRPYYNKCGGCDPDEPIVPIVLVHGWTSTSGIWGDLTNRLKADGFGPVWPVQLVPCGSEEERLFDPGNPATVKYLFRGNARLLSNLIRQKFNAMPSDSQARVQEIDIIAHSMGGLISRRYIKSYFPDDDWRSEQFKVRNLIMLGTPNQGSTFAGLWGAGNVATECHVGDPAYEELGTEYMKIFNKWFPDQQNGTNYFAAAGSRGVGPSIVTDCGANYGCYGGIGFFLDDCDFGGNDGIVRVRSARTRPTGSYYPGVVQFLCHNEYYSDANLYETFIKKVLNGQPFRDDSNRDIASSSESITLSYLHSDSLVTNVFASGSFILEANEEAHIYSLSSSSEFEFRITSPSSQVFDSASTSIDSSVVVHLGSGIRGYSLTNAESGQWQWEFILPQVPSTPRHFGVLSSVTNSITVTSNQNLDYLVPGDSLVLNIIGENGGLPITNLSVLSTPIYNNVDTLAQVAFIDDGLHMDGNPNDGVYGLVITNLQNGILSLRTTVDGNLPSGPIRRVLSQSAYVQSFGCGDADGSGIVTISDAVYLINYIFAGGDEPNPIQAGDADCNQIVTISDAVFLINYIFASGPAPCAACP